MKKAIFYIFTSLIVFAFLESYPLAQPKTVKIGWTGPLSGPAAEAGVGARQGSTLAMEEWNSKGGVYIEEYKKRIPIEILFEDAQSKPEIGVSLVEKFITRDQVHMVISDAFNSSVTMAVMELAPKYKIPIMSLMPVSDEISKKVAKNLSRYRYYWKMVFGSSAYTRNILNGYKYFIEQKLFLPKSKTIATLFEDTDYGRSTAGGLKEVFEQTGWKVVTMETVPLGQTDFYPYLSKIKSFNSDILVTGLGSLASGAAVVKQFQEVGLKCSHMAVTYPQYPEFILLAGKASEYLIWTPIRVYTKGFEEKIHNRWKLKATPHQMSGYEGVYNYLVSVERAGSLNPDKIVDALSKLDREGVIGRWVFNQSNHEIIDGEDFIPVPIAQIVGGKDVVILPPKMATQKYIPQPWVK